jgi:hypothetical protein
MDYSPQPQTQTLPDRSLDEVQMAEMSLQQIMDPARRFALVQLCQEVEASYDAIRGAALARVFDKFESSGEVAQLSSGDQKAFHELSNWALFSSIETQPNEVAQGLLERSVLMLLRSGVKVTERMKHVLQVWGEMDGTIVYRTYFLQALQRNGELLGSDNLEMPGEAPVSPTVAHWLATYDRFARHEKRSSIDRVRFLTQYEAAKKLSEREREFLLALLELFDMLLMKPVSIRGVPDPFAKPLVPLPAAQEPTKGFVEEYVRRPFNQQALRAAQEQLLTERAKGRNLLDMLDDAVKAERGVDVVAIFFLLARSRELGTLLQSADFRQRLGSYAGAQTDPRLVVKNVLNIAIGDSQDSAQIGVQLSNLLVAGGQRDYLGMVVFSQASGKYEWRV